MPDVVSKETRSRMMSGIRSKDTKHEISIRKSLHAAGYRYRLHRRDLPGTPDLSLPRFRAVVFIHGCFWHRHDCSLFKWPTTRSEFWFAKINGNRDRDEEAHCALKRMGWRIGVIWECALRGTQRRDHGDVMEELINWLHGDEITLVVEGDFHAE